VGVSADKLPSSLAAEEEAWAAAGLSNDPLAVASSTLPGWLKARPDYVAVETATKLVSSANMVRTHADLLRDPVRALACHVEPLPPLHMHPGYGVRQGCLDPGQACAGDARPFARLQGRGYPVQVVVHSGVLPASAP